MGTPRFLFLYYIFLVGLKYSSAADCQPTSDTYTTDSDKPERDSKFVPQPVTAISSGVSYVLDLESNSGHLSYSNDQIAGKVKASHLQAVFPGNIHYIKYWPGNHGDWWRSAQWTLNPSPEYPDLYTISSKNLDNSVVIVSETESKDGKWVGVTTELLEEYKDVAQKKNWTLWRIQEVGEKPKLVAIYSHAFPSNGLMTGTNDGDQKNFEFIQVIATKDSAKYLSPNGEFYKKSMWKVGLASEEEKNPFTGAYSDASQRYQVENSC